MSSVFDIILYVLIFLSVYVQVFFFVTFLENRKKIIIRTNDLKLNHYPAVTIAVPCWNEESTVEKTVHSLLNLNYPKNKIQIFLIDDGSTDNTWEVLNKFAGYSNIKIFHKQNGGKYTALNFALQNTNTEFFGGLDADSFADPDSLVRIMSYFEKDSAVMAVAPSVIVSSSKNIIRRAQRAEYHMGVYFKKMLAFLGAINVTPGPMTIFRKKVFDNLGGYKHGHNTEDMEIAYRMQKNMYKIEHCNDAFVYTNTPETAKKLYKQRLRWIYGFLNNTIDYRGVLFKRKYGNFALFTLPMGVISIISVSYLLGKILYNWATFIHAKALQFKIVGFNFYPKSFNPDPFFINTHFFVFLIIAIYALIVFSIVFGRKMTENKWGFSMDIIYFFPVFSIIAPLWIMRAMYNTLLRRKPNWR